MLKYLLSTEFLTNDSIYHLYFNKKLIAWSLEPITNLLQTEKVFLHTEQFNKLSGDLTYSARNYAKFVLQSNITKQIEIADYILSHS